MRKNVLALSIAAMIGGLGFAGAASADVVTGVAPLKPTTATTMSFAEGGVGHALLIPYFNAQNGNMTVMHVVNTDTSNGKAVKVRFRGALNSDDILDFQVFMSPGDVWTAAVTAGADGVAQIVTADGTCTLPTLAKGVNQRFVTDRLNPGIADADKANNTREGYVEIFNMADIPQLLAGTTTANPLYTAIKHVNGVAPCTPAALNATLQNFTTPAAVAAAGFDTPSTGLLGDWYIINVAQTTTFSGGATAIRAENNGAQAIANFVHFPQSASAAPSPDLYTADPLFRTVNVFTTGTTAPTTVPAIAAANYDLPDMSTPYVTAATATSAPLTQARLLTNALAVTSIANQYANDTSISAKTDWVFSMPTRRYNVASNYAAAQTGGNAAQVRYFSDLIATGNGVADERFNPANTSLATTGGAICVSSTGQAFFDREETTTTTGAVFSPGSITQTRFCGETSVLSFLDTGTSVLGGSVARQTLSTGSFTNGWSRVDVPNVVAGQSLGLPILGASFIKLSNPSAAAGTSGTYGITWPHRFTFPTVTP
ncbi:cell surface protein [Acidovorax sp. SUPP3434]|uniref:cell surface protein n=1 Tax=Acidovorax sp. SUPP3434 TaxID=2920880 RepID=UPI0023DE3508|nr:cell surface protein [Acidovorax sp. SUPP3434]GKS98654.1 cell surface protein [Acidovorax sp. SUPP3434]